MKKNKIYFLITFFSFLLLFSCNNENEIEDIEIHEQSKGLKKGTEEYNLGIIKIFKFDGNKSSIDENLAKELGFSKYQIDEFKKEIEVNNIFIENERLDGSIIEPFNKENLSAEKIYEDLKKNNEPLNFRTTSITGSINTTNQNEKQASFFNTIYTKCKFTPQARVATFPGYTVGTNTSGEWVRVTKVIPNVGVRASIEVPFQMSNTLAFISFRTSDSKGAYCGYTTL